ncbi:MAG: class I SAM-dependent methyltransferase [Terriglobales bacterium]
MAKRVCPWWLGYLLASPLRRLAYNPAEILRPYVRTGMTVLEPGPGMGFFTLELARLVGTSGRVVAVDVQPKMIDRLKRRAAKAGVLERIDARLARADSMGVADLGGSVDFTLAFAVVHEMPASGPFFADVARASKPGASVLFAEPAGHVSAEAFEAELQDAFKAGFALVDRPLIRRSQVAVLQRG